MQENNLYYQSTRGDKKRILSAEAIIKGIADDGGLFVPGVSRAHFPDDAP